MVLCQVTKPVILEQAYPALLALVRASGVEGRAQDDAVHLEYFGLFSRVRKGLPVLM